MGEDWGKPERYVDVTVLRGGIGSGRQQTKRAEVEIIEDHGDTCLRINLSPLPPLNNGDALSFGHSLTAYKSSEKAVLEGEEG